MIMASSLFITGFSKVAQWKKKTIYGMFQDKISSQVLQYCAKENPKYSSVVFYGKAENPFSELKLETYADRLKFLLYLFAPIAPMVYFGL